MSSLLPVQVYGLKVPAGDVMIPAIADFPATFRITMAAIDPSAAPEHTGTVNGDTKSRATLKLIYDANPGEDSDLDSDEGAEETKKFLKAIMAGRESEDEDEEDEDEEPSSDDDEENGGPSDLSKTKKARREAAMQQFMEALEAQNENEDEMEVHKSTKVNGVSKQSKVDNGKGKGKATAQDLEDENLEDDTEDSIDGMEEVVVCTLDPEKNCQQTLDLTIGEDQTAYFKVSGTHTIYLTGNYVVPADSGHSHEHGFYDGEDDEGDYDMSPDDDELDGDESDELDALEDPRVTEVASEDEEEPPKLVKKEQIIKKEEPAKKGKNKRAHEESGDEKEVPANLDDIMAKSLKPIEPTTTGETKLSKKQLKKLKNNAGKAVETAVDNKDMKKEDAAGNSSPAKGDKKVQFAKNLEQGPASSPDTIKTESKDKTKPESKKDEKPKASLGVKKVQGVTLDDKKLGTGPAAKKGSKVGMRYIGKLKDGKVFDSCKKGKPFSFTIGDGSVIKGWDIGVAGMQAGGERRIIIPADLAYGKKGVAGIPANSELTFDLKLLEVN